MRVYEVVSFYTMFNMAPVGRFHVQVCGTTPCLLGGSDDVLAACKNKGLVKGRTTPDGLFTLTEVECLGACANAPMVQINDDNFEDLDYDRTIAVLEALAEGKPVTPGSQTGRRDSCAVWRADQLASDGRGKPRLSGGMGMSKNTIVTILAIIGGHRRARLAAAADLRLARAAARDRARRGDLPRADRRQAYRGAEVTSFCLRLPELVSGSTAPLGAAMFVEDWMLKRVQHDGSFEAAR